MNTTNHNPTTLRDYLDVVDRTACRVFKLTGTASAPGIIHMASDDEGNIFMIPLPVGAPTENLRKVFTDMGVTRVVSVSEAWMVTGKSKDELDKRDRVTEQTPGAKEVIVYLCEDLKEGYLLAVRKILRSVSEAPQYGPLEIYDNGSMSGNMVGLLPRNVVLQ